MKVLLNCFFFFVLSYTLFINFESQYLCESENFRSDLGGLVLIYLAASLQSFIKEDDLQALSPSSPCATVCASLSS